MPSAMRMRQSARRARSAHSASRLARDPGPIRDILREHILDTVPVTRGHVVLGTPVTEPRVGTVASVAAAERLHPLTLRNILVAKGVVPVSRQHDPCGHIRALLRHMNKASDFMRWLRKEGDSLVASADLPGGRKRQMIVASPSAKCAPLGVRRDRLS